MKIPSCFYGTRQEAKKECAKVARKILKGEALLDAVAGYETIDTKDVPWDYKWGQGEGCLFVAHPFAINPCERHFFLTLVVNYIENKFEPLNMVADYENERNSRDRMFGQFIENDWSILGLSHNAEWWLGTSFGRCNDNRHQWQPYLRKMCEFWDVICGEGKRYVGGGEDIGTFWEINHTLRKILDIMGMPNSEKFPDDLKAICDKYNLLTMDVLNNPEILARCPFRD